MEILINDHQSIQEIQGKFSKVFPFLKLEFFTDPIKKEEHVAQKLLLSGDSVLAKYRSKHSITENIVISEKQKVSELKQLFQKIYGLAIQVFRKIGDVWLETTSTNDWTFEKQNNEAFKMSLIS